MSGEAGPRPATFTRDGIAPAYEDGASRFEYLLRPWRRKPGPWSLGKIGRTVSGPITPGLPVGIDLALGTTAQRNRLLEVKPPGRYV